MKSLFVTTAITRNLGLSLGIGLSLGLGVLGVSAYSSSRMLQTTPTEAKESTSAPLISKPKTAKSTALEAATPLASQATKQGSPASPMASPSTPIPVEASTVTNEDLEQTIRQVIPGLATCPHAQGTNPSPHPSITDASDTLDEHRYIYHPVDLNGDRHDELIVHIMGPMTCGTGGCTTLILGESANRNTSNYDVVTQMSVVNFPVMVSDRTSSGWNDLLVMVSGGGAQPGYRHLKFDGQSYPTNPSLEPIVSEKELPNDQVLMVSEAGRAIAPVITATDCQF